MRRQEKQSARANAALVAMEKESREGYDTQHRIMRSKEIRANPVVGPMDRILSKFAKGTWAWDNAVFAKSKRTVTRTAAKP